MFDMEAFRHGTSFPMMLHWDLFLPNEGLWPKTEIIKDEFARIGVFFFSYWSSTPATTWGQITIQNVQAVLKRTIWWHSDLQVSEIQTHWRASLHFHFFCLEFMAALSLLAHSEGSTEPGRHPIPQWQQQGVIITIRVKVLPIFHARGHTARKGGRRGFKKKNHTSVW